MGRVKYKTPAYTGTTPSMPLLHVIGSLKHLGNDNQDTAHSRQISPFLGFHYKKTDCSNVKHQIMIVCELGRCLMRQK